MGAESQVNRTAAFTAAGQTHPQRIMVMGPPGSGKSTLAKNLGAQLGLPVFHLDQAFWRPNWVQAPEDEFRAEINRIAALPAWVIDGNYIGTLAPRLAAADTMIYLDVPRERAMWRILRRSFSSFRRVRPGSAPGCAERLEWEFLQFAWTWNKVRRVSHLAFLETFPGRSYILPREATKLAALIGDCFKTV
jgi:adenylate kinase family enzyme